MKISGVDKEKVLQMLQKEYECTHEQAQEKLDSLGKLIPEMWALFEAWCREEAVEYTFQDISLSYIVGKVRCSFVESIVWMNRFIQNPELIEHFKIMNFDLR
jgi:hypothetical protein